MIANGFNWTKTARETAQQTGSNGEYFIYMWCVAWYDLERNEFSNVCTLNIVYITTAKTSNSNERCYGYKGKAVNQNKLGSVKNTGHIDEKLWFIYTHCLLHQKHQIYTHYIHYIH